MNPPITGPPSHPPTLLEGELEGGCNDLTGSSAEPGGEAAAPPGAGVLEEHPEPIAADQATSPTWLPQGVEQEQSLAGDELAVRFTGWDFSVEPEPPRWQWHGVLEESTVTLLSGKWSSAKSLVTAGLVAATVKGEAFLERSTSGSRVLMLDAENPTVTTFARLRSLGVTNDHRERLRHVGRDQHPEVGSPKWELWLDEQLDRFDPALITIDGAVSSTTVRDPNDVDGVKHLYSSLGRALDGHPAAVLMLHHERKPKEGERGEAGYASIGTVYWQNLADTTYALDPQSSEEVETATGHELRTVVRWQVTKPPRSARPPELGHIAATGTLDARESLSETVIELTVNPGFARLVQALTLHGDPMGAGALARAVGMDPDSGAWSRLRRDALKAKAIYQDKEKGPYRLPEQAPSTPPNPPTIT